MPSRKHHTLWITRTLSRLLLTAFGWKVIANFDGVHTGMVLGVPHTSNWDGIIAIPAMFALDVNFRWIGKESLFRGIMGPISRGVGGIPIDRSKHQNFVQQSIALFAQQDDLFIVLAPEGTRKYTPYWKTGFYHIARGANVPLILGYIDYQRKEVGFGAVLHLTGDVETDLENIRAFYADKHGRHPENMGEIRFAPDQKLP